MLIIWQLLSLLLTADDIYKSWPSFGSHKGFRKSSWCWRTPGGFIVIRWYLSWALRQALYMLLGPSCPQYPLLMSDIINGLQHYFLLSSESFSWLLKNCLWLMGIDPGGTVFSLSPDIQTNYPSHAFGGPLQSCLCSLSVSSSPCDQQVLEKVASGGPELAPLWVSAAGREVQTHQPLPRSLRKGPAFWHLRALGGDRKEGETLTSCREPQPAQTFAGWRVTPGAGCCSPPRSPLGASPSFGVPR